MRKLVFFALLVVIVSNFCANISFAVRLNHSAIIIKRSSIELDSYNHSEINSADTVTVHFDSTIECRYLKLIALCGQGRIIKVSVIAPDSVYYVMGL